MMPAMDFNLASTCNAFDHDCYEPEYTLKSVPIQGRYFGESTQEEIDATKPLFERAS